MKRKMAILVDDLYENLELWYPALRLREAGFDVDIVGAEEGAVYKSKEGYPAKATVGMKEALEKAHEYQGLVIPGGYAPDKMRRRPEMVQLVKTIFDEGKLVATICHGGWMLAEADVARGKTLTCVPAIKTDLINAGARYVDEEVVVDGNLVTSRTPADLPAFLKAILQHLEARV